MTIPKSTKVDEILDLLATCDISVREILSELMDVDVDEYVLGLMPMAVLTTVLTELRQRHQALVS